MSGRLIILPKKSYCPWKPENVERVLRDERLERERQEREAETQKQVESRQRLKSLRGNASAAVDGGGDDNDHPRHINLFEDAEKALLEEATRGREKKKKEETKVGVMPVVLGASELRIRGEKRPFYLRDPSKEAVTEEPSEKERKRLDRMDPMQAFVRPSSQENKIVLRPKSDDDVDNESRLDASSDSEDSRKQRTRRKGRKKKKKKKERETSRRKKRRRRHKDYEHAEHNDSTMQEMRQRRVEREKRESARAAELLAKKDPLNDRDRAYQNQYHPSLSRR